MVGLELLRRQKLLSALLAPQAGDAVDSDRRKVQVLIRCMALVAAASALALCHGEERSRSCRYCHSLRLQMTAELRSP